MSTDIGAAEMIMHVAASNWPLIVCVAFLIISLAGITSLFLRGVDARKGDAADDNVVNFERWRT